MDASEFTGETREKNDDGRVGWGDGSGEGYYDCSGDGYGWGDGSGKCLVDGSERGWCDDWGDVFGFGYGRGSCP